MLKTSASAVFLIITLASFIALFAMPAQAALPQAQNNLEPIAPSYRVKTAQNQSVKKPSKRQNKKYRYKRTRDGRRNYYDPEINNRDGRPTPKGKRNLREEWCLDCFVGI